MSIALPPELESRRHQMFPELTAAEIARIGRFGSVRSYQPGERLLTAGAPNPGMLIVLKGTVAISQRDGMGHVVPIAHQGRGQFLAEVGQLSRRCWCRPRNCER
jgi:thioredoxin reductase (NADPH)